MFSLIEGQCKWYIQQLIIYSRYWFTRRNTNDSKSSSPIDVLRGDIRSPDWLKTRSIGADDAWTEKTRLTTAANELKKLLFHDKRELMWFESLRYKFSSSMGLSSAFDENGPSCSSYWNSLRFLDSVTLYVEVPELLEHECCVNVWFTSIFGFSSHSSSTRLIIACFSLVCNRCMTAPAQQLPRAESKSW